MHQVKIICNRVNKMESVSIVSVNDKLVGYFKSVNTPSARSFTAFTSYGKTESVCCELHAIDKLIEWHGPMSQQSESAAHIDEFMDAFFRALLKSADVKIKRAN